LTPMCVRERRGEKKGKRETRERENESEENVRVAFIYAVAAVGLSVHCNLRKRFFALRYI